MRAKALPRITAEQIASALGIQCPATYPILDPAEPYKFKAVTEADIDQDTDTAFGQPVHRLPDGTLQIAVPNFTHRNIQRGARAKVGQYTVHETRQFRNSKATFDVRVDISERIHYDRAKAQRAARGWLPGRGALA